jgi:peptidyl-prolyl cis-trans isomerase SurA
MRVRKSITLLACCVWLGSSFNVQPSLAGGQSLLAVVNDQAITSLDIEQQIKLNAVLGNSNTGAASRKRALDDIVNQVVKISEAKRYKMAPSDSDIDARIAEIGKGLGTDGDKIENRLDKQGISMAALRQYVAAQISFARLIRFKYKAEFTATDAEIDRKSAEIKNDLDSRISKVMNDPRMRPVTVASMIEIIFPIEKTETGMEQLLQSRALEANQYLAKFNGCKTAKAAAAGIFNVRVSKSFDADMSKFPKPLKAMLDKKRPGSAVGPMRSKDGIQVLAYCSQRTINPKRPNAPMPTREQISRAVVNEKFDAVEQKYLVQMRKNAIIEYKQTSALQ